MEVEETTNNGTMQAVIPTGFYYVTGTPSTGMVISNINGDDENNSKGGNQFVWVPCSGEDGVTYEKENGLATTWKANYSSKQYWYTDYTDDTETTTNEDGTTSSETLTVADGTWSDNGGDSTSVQKYGGFYVARYEAGVPNSNFYSVQDGAAYITTSVKNVSNLKPVSKKDTFSWNYISQTNAVTLSSNMYSDSESVTSSLIDSYAWDTIVEWMEKNETGIATNSINRGNYTNSNFSVSNGMYALHRLESLTTAAQDANAQSIADGGSNIYTAKGWQSIYKKVSTSVGYLGNISKETNDSYGFSSYEYRDTTYYYYNLFKEILTGSASETKINNIYDMAGNI